MDMFKTGDVVKILIPNVVNAGYDYRLTAPADLGSFVRVSVMNRPYIGVVYGIGDSALPPEKIKNTIDVFPDHLSVADLQWIQKMSNWTLMTPGAVLRLIVNVPDAFSPPRMEQLYAYNHDDKIRMTDARQSVADAFASNDNDAMSVSDIQNIAHVSGAVVRGMITHGALIPTVARRRETDFSQYQYHDMGNVTLNAEQSAAAHEICTAIDNGGFSVYLLDGITGSGKTGDIRMVVGTRSALFLPWQNLGLIVVDEEHDTSYKQEDMGNYHARDMAVLRAKIAGFPIVLASATPSAETVQHVADGKYKCLKLTSRFGGASLPKIETIDMRENRPTQYTLPTDTDDAAPRAGYLSPLLCDAVRDTLAAGHQVMLFINRRGFAPIVQCKKCGWVAQCPDCSVGMTYHKHLGKLLCHMCGRTMTLPSQCPTCGNEISYRGAGLEKIQEEVSIKFPAARTALVSSDTILSRQALERIVHKMENGETDIVIGTQILAKGHHFPNLTLVGVVDADMGLFGTDFRAAEHTFQQLFQVAGRAGRGDAPGRVLLQTYQPDHPVLTAICDGNRDAFMATDMAARRVAKMPPYGQLIALIIEANKESTLKNFCAALATAAPTANGVKIMGPIAAQIYQVRNWYRMRFLVTGDARTMLQPFVAHWLAHVRTPANVRV